MWEYLSVGDTLLLGMRLGTSVSSFSEDLPALELPPDLTLLEVSLGSPSPDLPLLEVQPDFPRQTCCQTCHQTSCRIFRPYWSSS